LIGDYLLNIPVLRRKKSTPLNFGVQILGISFLLLKQWGGEFLTTDGSFNKSQN